MLRYDDSCADRSPTHIPHISSTFPGRPCPPPTIQSQLNKQNLLLCFRCVSAWGERHVAVPRPLDPPGNFPRGLSHATPETLDSPLHSSVCHVHGVVSQLGVYSDFESSERVLHPTDGKPVLLPLPAQSAVARLAHTWREPTLVL